MISNLSKINVPIQVKASLAVLSAQLCFSGWHIVASVAFKGGANPLVFLLDRFIIATILMQAYVKYYRMNQFIEAADHKRLLLVGFLSFLNVFCGSMALKFIAPARFAIFQPSIPCIVTGISMLFQLEAVNYLKIGGIALAVAGAFTAELWKEGGSTSDTDEANVPLGVFLATTQVFAMGLVSVVVKPLLNKYEPAVVSGMNFMVSSMSIITIILCRVDLIPSQDYIFNGETLPWMAILYVSFFATMYAFGAINWGGKYLPPTVTTVFFTFQPVGTIILSATLLGSIVTVPEIVGGLLIVAGLVVTSYAQTQGGTRLPSGVDFSEIESKAHTRAAPTAYNPIHEESVEQAKGLKDFASAAPNETVSFNPPEPDVNLLANSI